MTRREEIVNNIGYQLTHAAIDYIKKHEFADRIDCFEAGAEWMQETMIEKVCDWLKNVFYEQEHEYDYGYYITLETTFDELNDVIDDFRKAMEE